MGDSVFLSPRLEAEITENAFPSQLDEFQVVSNESGSGSLTNDESECVGVSV